MADCWVRLGFALCAITLITGAFYLIGSPNNAVAIEPPALASAR